MIDPPPANLSELSDADVVKLLTFYKGELMAVLSNLALQNTREGEPDFMVRKRGLLTVKKYVERHVTTVKDELRLRYHRARPTEIPAPRGCVPVRIEPVQNQHQFTAIVRALLWKLSQTYKFDEVTCQILEKTVQVAYPEPPPQGRPDFQRSAHESPST